MRKLILLLAFSLVFLIPSGAVFAQSVDIAAKVDRSEVLIGEPFVLTVTIKQKSDAGRINIGNLKYPDLSAFKQTGSSNSSYFNFTGGAAQSVSEFQLTLSPTQKGTFIIGSILLPYKDSSGQEFTAQTPPIQITATEKKSNSPSVIINTGDKEEKPKRKRGYGIEITAVVILAGLLYGLHYKRKKDKTNFARNQKAPKKEYNIPNENSEIFFDELSFAVKEYLADKYGLDQKRSTQEFLAALNEKSLVHYNDVEKLLTVCDHAKFAKAEVNKHELTEIAKKIIL